MSPNSTSTAIQRVLFQSKYVFGNTQWKFLHQTFPDFFILHLNRLSTCLQRRKRKMKIKSNILIFSWNLCKMHWLPPHIWRYICCYCFSENLNKSENFTEHLRHNTKICNFLVRSSAEVCKSLRAKKKEAAQWAFSK